MKQVLNSLLLLCYLSISLGLGTQARPVPEAQAQAAICAATGCACAKADSPITCCCVGKKAKAPHTRVFAASYCDIGFSSDVLFTSSGFKVHHPETIALISVQSIRLSDWLSAVAVVSSGYILPIDKVPI